MTRGRRRDRIEYKRKTQDLVFLEKETGEGQAVVSERQELASK